MTANNETFLRANGTYNVDAAMERAALLRRRSQRVALRRLCRVVTDGGHRLLCLVKGIALSVGEPKGEAR